MDAVVLAVPGWIERVMTARIVEQRGEVTDDVRRTISLAGESVSACARARLSQLLATDVDAQSTNPLSVLRGCTAGATQTLRSLGIPEVVRDQFERSSMPDDVYALGPLTWRDLSDEVHDAGITWGAWKAATVLSRRRSEGKLQ